MITYAARVSVALAAMGTGASAAPDFATRTQAMHAISSILPKATAANPAYLTKADGTVTRWMTDAVVFETGADGVVTVTMREHYFQTKAARKIAARHVASFAMGDVTVKPEVDPGDFTPSGEPATGLTFTCQQPNCVAAHWNDAASRSNSTDVSIQNPATRDLLLAAFRRLQAP